MYRKFKPRATSPDRGAVNSLSVWRKSHCYFGQLGGASVGGAQSVRDRTARSNSRGAAQSTLNCFSYVTLT